MIHLMNLSSGDLVEIVGHNIRGLLGVFVSIVMKGLRSHMTRESHVTGVTCMLRGVEGPCPSLALGTFFKS